MREIMLIVTIIMPGDRPDIRHHETRSTMDACWADAKAYMDRPMSAEVRHLGALGLGASCAFVEKPAVEQ